MNEVGQGLARLSLGLVVVRQSNKSRGKRPLVMSLFSARPFYLYHL